MKYYNIIVLVLLTLFNAPLYSQENYLVDNYDDPTLWTQVGINVEISNNEVNFKNLSLGGEQRRVYRELDEPLLSTDNWKFSFDFIYSALGSRSNGPTVGHYLLSLTEDNLEPARDCPDIACTGNPSSTTDYISIYYGNAVSGGSNRFHIISRVDGVTKNSEFIFFYNPNQKLYFDLEKIGHKVFIRVFEDENRTILLNNQEEYVDVTGIEPMSFIQHGVSAGGDYRRGLTGKIDNLVLDKNFTSDCGPFSMWHANETTIFSNFSKNIGIGTSDAQSKLSIVGNLGVDGDIMAKGIIARPIIWPDYVFENDYNLRTLADLETFIKKNAHLPNVPSQKEVAQNGIDLPNTDAILLEKIEELTLYLIEMNKKIKELEDKLAQLESDIKE